MKNMIKYGFGSSLCFIVAIFVIVGEHSRPTPKESAIFFQPTHEQVCQHTLKEILDPSRPSTFATALEYDITPPNKDWQNILVDGVKTFEGYYREPYRCPAGVLTVGYGHTGKYRNRSMSEQEAARILLKELEKAAEIVDRIVTVELDENQRAALISFTFNAGEGNLKRLVSGSGRLNNGNYASIEKILPQYRKGGGKVLRGLVKRRNWELALWNGEIEIEDEEG